MPDAPLPFPSIRLQIVADASPLDRNGFLRVRRQRLRAHYPDGTVSEEFVYDQVDREALDAVVMVAHFRDASDRLNVFLRSAVRPPAALRPLQVRPIPEKPSLGHLWEMPAGLVEASERSAEGLKACACRELDEELGLCVPLDAMLPLGPSTFPSPGVIGERHFYFHARVDPSLRHPPRGDGSALERHAAIVSLPLDEALDWVRRGDIEDAKTEIALRRLAELVP